jgi:hypothetical protein
VARRQNPPFKMSTRIEHRTRAAATATATAQGMTDASNLLAAPETRKAFAPVPYLWPDQYGMTIQAYGYLRGHDEVAVAEGNLTERRLVAGYRTGDRLNGPLAIGMPPRSVPQRRLAIAVRSAWRDAVPIRP